MEKITITSEDELRLEAAEHKAKGNSKGTVILLHGLTTDMKEGSGELFVRLAGSLTEENFNALRFSFRGHGKSEGKEQGATIAGEMLDLKAAFEHAKERFERPYYIIAASFGAVSTCLSLPYIEKDLKALVLWYPVLDLEKTIIDPGTDWGRKNFTGEKLKELERKGYMEYENGFKIGRVLYQEIRQYDPMRYFLNSELPVLIVHSREDEYVPFKFSKKAERERNNFKLVSVPESGHGFDSHEEGVSTVEKEGRGIDTTVDWIDKISRE